MIKTRIVLKRLLNNEQTTLNAQQHSSQSSNKDDEQNEDDDVNGQRPKQLCKETESIDKYRYIYIVKRVRCRSLKNLIFLVQHRESSVHF
jgi:hypothetical protein